MKCSSEHYFIHNSFASISSWNSCSTFSNKWRGTLLRLCWNGVKFSFILYFATWFFDPPKRLQVCIFFCKIIFMIFFLFPCLLLSVLLAFR